MKKNIVLIGKYPPPYGGITVHIQRLHKYLSDNNYNCYICHTGLKTSEKNIKNIISIFNIIGVIRLKKLNPIIHFHISEFGNLLKIFGLTLFFISQIKIVTIHSGSFVKNFHNYSNLRKYIINLILRRFKKIISVNKDQKNILVQHFNISNEKIDIIPAFLTPSTSDVGIEKSKLLKIHNSKDIKIVTSGYIYDYYGFDMIADYFIKNNNILGIFAFYDKYDTVLKNKLLEKINPYENILYFFDLTPTQFNWIMKNSDIYIRNTDRDGDCVAIREAAYWGKKILATDVVDRPKGTELFSFNNMKDFEVKLNDVIKSELSGIINSSINYEKKIEEVYTLI